MLGVTLNLTEATTGETAIIQDKLQFAYHQNRGRVALQVIIYLTMGGPEDRCQVPGRPPPDISLLTELVQVKTSARFSSGSVILDTRTTTAVMMGLLAPSNLARAGNRRGESK